MYKRNTNQEWLITWEGEVVHDTDGRRAQEKREHRRMHGYRVLADMKENGLGKGCD